MCTARQGNAETARPAVEKSNRAVDQRYNETVSSMR